MRRVLLLAALAAGCGGGGGASAGSPGDAGGRDAPAADGAPRSDAAPADGAAAAGEGGADAGRGDASATDGATGRDAGGDGATAADAGGLWSPTSAQPVHFHWQLSDAFSYPADVRSGPAPVVYDLDGETTDAATVAALHAIGARVICYVDVGTWENFRSDAASFPAAVIGQTNGWPGEKWLDVRQQSVLLPIMQARFASWCQAKGFDAIEPDNLDGWQNTSGFPLTQADNLSYDLAIASLGHAMGLSMGLKNLPQQAPSLEPHFEWALDEECFHYSECGPLEASFIARGKAVFEVEYAKAPDCAAANAAHMNSQLRDKNLHGPAAASYLYQPCEADTATAW